MKRHFTLELIPVALGEFADMDEVGHAFDLSARPRRSRTLLAIDIMQALTSWAEITMSHPICLLQFLQIHPK